ncbi:MAG: DNA polymerase III subunit alpha [Deinococcota bacterium]|nr:DNA polymerase III subunit alpha [Deinococcota bacterium]
MCSPAETSNNELGKTAPKRFAHLHQHTAYSLLDGAARISDLMRWVKETSPDNPALAMTDHGNMHGAVEFYKAAEKEGVKPIIGFEAYVSAGSRFEKKRGSDKLDGGYFHLTLLAKDFKGYQNLCKLNSRGWLEGFYMKPRVDHELLREYSEGVIALSGCLGAQIPRYLLDIGFDAGEGMLKQYLDIYGGDFFIELQDHGLGEQTRLNPMLKALADKYGLGMVATNDGHYVKKEDAKAHEALLAIQTKTTLSDPKRFKFPCEEFYVKTPAEMAALIPERDYPGAFANTQHIAELCNVELPIGPRRVYQMPELPIPKGRTLAEQLRVQTYQGLMGRYQSITEEVISHYLSHHLAETGLEVPEGLEAKLLRLATAGELCQRASREAGEKYVTYAHLEALKAEPGPVQGAALLILERAEYELGVIISMGFPDYLLIVADFINWAKDHGVAVGPGRGSGAGSIVCYATRITNVDPLQYGLLFERFLNPDRVSMPDIDVDFSDTRRMEVVDYVRQKYGEDKVAQIATFGTMASKAAIKDAARVLEAPYADADRFSKLIPVVFGRSTPIKKAMEEVSDLRTYYQTGSQEFVDVAIALEGLTRHASVHAAGVIIAREPVQELAPVFRSGDGPIVCQYDMGSIEELGFLKMDFLGLRTLSFIEAAVRIVGESRGVELDPDDFPLEDPETFELLSRGDAAGVFQFESGGMVDTLRKLKPRRIQDLIAVSALYRPGPMENIPTYIRRHHGLEEVDYSRQFPVAESFLEPILAETYGIPVYQEQILKIAQAVAGYSLGEADLLRKAMGKKIVEAMVKHRTIFEKGAANNGIPADEANAIFDLLEKFANYGFNKAHSTAYGMLSYQTAYLKAHYPVEFAAALLTVERANSDKVAEYAADARHMGIAVLPPDINESRADFTPVGKVVRFGLFGVKNVGDAAVEHILKERARGGPFKDFYDFCERAQSSLVNKRATESLVKAGAFDAFGERATLLATVEAAVKWGAAQRENAASGQLSLFGAEGVPPPPLQGGVSLNRLELLRLEKEALGLYISDHPMNSYPGLADVASCTVEALESWCRDKLEDTGRGHRCRAALAGILQNVVKRSTKSGSMMARFTVADETGAREVVAFSRAYEEMAAELAEDAPVVVIVEVAREEDSLRLVAERLIRWDKRGNLPEVALIEFDLQAASETMLVELRSWLDECAGMIPLRLKLRAGAGTALYAAEALGVDKDKLGALEMACPWLKASLSIDRDQLLRSSAGRKPWEAKEKEALAGADIPF